MAWMRWPVQVRHGPLLRKNRRVRRGGFCFEVYSTYLSLFDVRRDELRHLEHCDLAFAVEDFLQLFIREDVPLVRRILKVVLLDVFPKLLDHL